VERSPGVPTDTLPRSPRPGNSLTLFRKLWLIFAQAATVSVAVLFVIATFQPHWLLQQGFVPNWLPLGTHGRASVGGDGDATGSRSDPTYTTSYAEAARRAMPAVVNINTSKQVAVAHNPFGDDPLFRRFFGDQLGSERQQIASLGSGVIVSPEGYILTNNHVIEAADEIEVALADGRKAKAKVVGSDPDTDLAVVRISLKNLPTMPFGQYQKVQVGDVVLAIGNPFAVGQTVTMGIVSALGRNHLGINTFENFIQTDAAINPGNSGGALVDAQGSLIGINTAIYSNNRAGGSLGIGFAIPVNTARQVMESIVATGSVVRGYIGVEPQEITPELVQALQLPRSSGALIAGVMRNGPADRAGIHPGDILVAVESQPTEDTTAMLYQIAQLKPGSSATVTVVRGNQQLTLAVNVGKRPKPQPQPEN
jgi:serine protease DegQ